MCVILIYLNAVRYLSDINVDGLGLVSFFMYIYGFDLFEYVPDLDCRISDVSTFVRFRYVF